MRPPSGDLDVPASRDGVGSVSGHVKIDAPGSLEPFGRGLATEEREARDLGFGTLPIGAGGRELRAPENSESGGIPFLQAELEDVPAVRCRHCVENAKSGRG